MKTKETVADVAAVIKTDSKLLEVVALAKKTVNDNPGHGYGFFASVKFKKQFFAKGTMEYKVFSLALEYAFFDVAFPGL